MHGKQDPGWIDISDNVRLDADPQDPLDSSRKSRQEAQPQPEKSILSL
jgi:hypothetical protein